MSSIQQRTLAEVQDPAGAIVKRPYRRGFYLLTLLTLLHGCTGSVEPMPPAGSPDGPPAAQTDMSLPPSWTTLPVSGWRDRVIYFVLLDRFRNASPGNDKQHGDAACNDSQNAHAYQGGDLAGLRHSLDYIQELGADALWITPLYRGVPSMAGRNCGFPGYWADFADPYVLDLDPRFGTEAEFQSLLNEVHGRGMPLMLDMVVNHAGYGSRLVKQHPDWFTDPRTCAMQGPADIYCSLAGLPDFDHRVPAVRSYLIDLHRVWLDRFPIDAIRMDTVKHVEPSYFAQWTAAMRITRPGLYMIGELLDEGRFDLFDTYLASGFDGLFNFPLRRALIETFAKGSSVDIAAARMSETITRFGMAQTSTLVNLLDNHDVPRFLEEIPAGVSGKEAQGRYLLALAALLTLPGVPQIYYGNELGMYGGQDPYNRRFMPDWAFSVASRPGQRPGFLPEPDMIFEHVKKLLRIRKSLPALQHGSYQELWRQNGPANNNVWAYLRKEPGSLALVVHNNGLLATDGAVPLEVTGVIPDGTVLVDALGAAGLGALTVQAGRLAVALPGRSTVILVPQK